MADPSALLTLALGTVRTTAGALALGGVASLCAAVWVSELAPPWVPAHARRLFEGAAAVPAVVWGHAGLVIVWRTGAGDGGAPLVLALTLGTMIAPTVTLLALQALARVPSDVREASLALGASRWQTAWRAVVPWARGGLLGAVVTGVARASGEALAVALVAASAGRGGCHAPTLATSLLCDGDLTRARGRTAALALLALAGLLALLARRLDRVGAP